MTDRSRTDAPLTAERLQSLVRALGGRRVLVVGDLLADEFIYGRVERVSREAPVLILRYDQTIVLPGGAGNAASNVAALGGRVVLAARVGRDDAGRRLVASLPKAVSRAALVRPASYHTPLKTRILAGGVHSAKQQVVRIDRVRSAAHDATTGRAVWQAAAGALKDVDAVLVSDYGSGLVTPDRVSALQRRRSPAPPRAAPHPARLAARHAVLSGPDGLHAERVRGRAPARRGHRRRPGRARAGGTDRAEAHGHGGRAGNPRQPRHGAVRVRPTHAPHCHLRLDEVADVTVRATPSSRRSRWGSPPAPRSTRPRGWQTMPAGSSS
jgi:hypothetical protein